SDPFIGVFVEQFRHPPNPFSRWRVHIALLYLRQIGGADTDQLGKLPEAVALLKAFLPERRPKWFGTLAHDCTCSSIARNSFIRISGINYDISASVPASPCCHTYSYTRWARFSVS